MPEYSKVRYPLYPIPESEQKQYSIPEYINAAYAEWWQFLDMKEVAEVYKVNQKACKDAIKEYKKGPIKVLAIHGSGRGNVITSCAHELSNSQMLLKEGLKVLDEDDVEVEEVVLRDYKIEPCNNCYSTSSALCGWPCDCFPIDPMQKLYPKVLRSEVLLMSTGVNQSAMSTRLKAFSDRLISLDGGYYREELQQKDNDFRQKMIKTSTEQKIIYDQRHQGRVCAFFISSKDERDMGGEDGYGRPFISYVTLVRESLYRGYHDYGCIFAEPWWAVFAANPYEEMSHDKQRLNKDKKAHARAREVVTAAVRKARVLRENPEPPRKHPQNRT